MHLEVTDVRTLTDSDPDIRVFEFRHGLISIGSDSSSTLQLPDIDIPPHFANLVSSGEDEWAYEPVIRGVAVVINKKPVTEKTILQDGDVIEITRFELKVTKDVVADLVLPEAGNVEELAKIRQFPLPPRSVIRKAGEEISLRPAHQQALAKFLPQLRDCRDFPRLLSRTAEMLLSELGARTVWIGVRRGPTGDLEYTEGRSDQGLEVVEPAKLEAFLYRCLARQQFIRIPRTGDPDTQSVIAVPILGEQGPVGLIYMDTRRRTTLLEDADLDFVTLIATILTPHLQAFAQAQSEKVVQLQAAELALLREIQLALEPASFPQWPQLEAASLVQRGAERASDVHDAMRLPNGLAAFLIAHISAPGKRAALVMAQLRGTFRMAGLHADPAHVQLKALNWLFQDDTQPDGIDAAIVIMNPKTGAAEYCTAGQIGLYVIDAEGQARSLTLADSPRIGPTKNVDYKPATARLNNGETLAFFTLGAKTARNAAGTVLGLEPFLDAICDGFGQSSSSALTELQADLQPFFKDGVTPDDITLMLVHRTAEAG